MSYIEWKSVVLDNGGSASAAVDGSSTPVDFTYTVPTNAALRAERLLVTMQAPGSLTGSDYGGVTGPLTNGVDLLVNGVSILDGMPVKSNNDWAHFCYDVNIQPHASGSSLVHVRWTFGKSGAPLWLRAGETITAKVQDNLTGLDEHLFLLQGYLRHRKWS